MDCSDARLLIFIMKSTHCHWNLKFGDGHCKPAGALCERLSIQTIRMTILVFFVIIYRVV